MRMTQFQLGTARIRTGWSEGPIRQSGYPPTDDPHIPSSGFILGGEMASNQKVDC